MKISEKSKEKIGKNIQRGTRRNIYLERKMGDDERQKTYGRVRGEMEGKCRGNNRATDTLPLEGDRWKGRVCG